MFTIEQIKQAHSKVKSGADFPAYIRDIKDLGVTRYDTFVADGHSNYFSSTEYTTSSTAKYDLLEVAATTDANQFIADLKAHQQGKTDYMTFCNDCAKSGIVKWVVDIDKMTCTYYDAGGVEILVENVPG